MTALEGLAALNLAGNVIQFIDFGCRLFSKSRELYKSTEDTLTENKELERIASTLESLARGLADDSSQRVFESDEDSLISLARNCKDIAKTLLVALDRLKVRNSYDKWQCFRVALQKIWKSKEIDSISKKLDAASIHLNTCLIKILQSVGTLCLSDNLANVCSTVPRIHKSCCLSISL